MEKQAAKRKMTTKSDDNQNLVKRAKDDGVSNDSNDSNDLNDTGSTGGSDSAENALNDDSNSQESGATDKSVELVNDVVYVNNTDDQIDDSVAHLQLVTEEGASIGKLCIQYQMTGVQSLLDAVTKHCGENLLELVLRYIPGEERSTKEFKAGVKAFRAFLQQCGQHFPDLRSLKVAYSNAPAAVDIKLWKEIVYNFPELVALTLENVQKFPLEPFCNQNRQLEQLELNSTANDWRMTTALLETLDEMLPELKHLTLTALKFTTKKNTDNGRLRFENLQTVTIHCVNKSHKGVLDFVNMVGRDIESLTLIVNGKFDKETFNKAIGYKKLKHLSINLALANEHLVDLGKKAPQIEELKFNGGAVTPDGLSDLVKKAKDLRKITIAAGEVELSLERAEEFIESVQKRLKTGQWNGFVDTDGAIIIENLEAE